MRRLLDTNTLSYLLKGHPTVLERMEASAQRGDEFLLAPIVHYELARYLDLKGALRLIRIYLELTSTWRRVSLDFADWATAANWWADRHRRGKAIADLDLLLAVLAWREGAVVVTANQRHFAGLDVSVEDWTQP